VFTGLPDKESDVVSKSASKKRAPAKKAASKRAKVRNLAVPSKKSSNVRGGVVAVEPYASMMMETE
jgi:hypothetical protein